MALSPRLNTPLSAHSLNVKPQIYELDFDRLSQNELVSFNNINLHHPNFSNNVNLDYPSESGLCFKNYGTFDHDVSMDLKSI